jgi:hypothetical protein
MLTRPFWNEMEAIAKLCFSLHFQRMICIDMPPNDDSDTTSPSPRSASTARHGIPSCTAS